MNSKELIRNYLKALEKISLREVMRHFSEDAIIKSSFDGVIKAADFFSALFSITTKAKVHVSNIFMNLDGSNCAAVHFKLDWKSFDGAQAQFDCVDIFEFDTNESKVSRLTIVYDSYFVRRAFEKSKSGG